jgi:hypothetical protein
MAQALNTKLLSHVDCAGGGQVWVEGTTLYIGHMRHPSGTTIVDVADPRDPKILARIDMPDGWHSHKVRASGDIMIVNHEKLGQGGDEALTGGLGIYDVSKPAEPRLITNWRTGGKGVHRYDFDGRYAYISATDDGYIGNFVKILDLKDPANPEEVGRWWIPGQWEAGGEEYPWADWTPPRCHHPIRRGDRLYVSYWHHGFFILDISDMSNPKPISGVNTSPLYPHPTHTCLPFKDPIAGRDIMIVADEDVAKLYPAAPSFTWVYDITVETVPTSIATWQVEGLRGDNSPQEPMTGCHQPSERVAGTIVPFAWFAQGLRILDFADPYNPREIGHFTPDAPAGSDRPSSNDVTIDDRGIIYLIDRVHGVDIIETSVF